MSKKLIFGQSYIMFEVTMATSEIVDTQMTYHNVRERWTWNKPYWGGGLASRASLPLYVQGLKEQN